MRRKLRPEVDSGIGVLREGAVSRLPTSWGLGERCKLPSGVPGRQTVYARFKCLEWPFQPMLFIVPRKGRIFLMLIILGVYWYNFQLQ